MKKIHMGFILLTGVIIVSAAFFLAAPTFIPFNVATPPLLEAPPSPVSIPAVSFYGDGCSHCEKIKPLICDLETRYPELHLTRLEIYHNPGNSQKFVELSKMYGITNPGVPIIFIGKTSLLGEVEIKDRFESEILIEKQRLASCNETTQQIIPEKEPAGSQEFSQLNHSLVIFAAMVDSINPCGLSVIVFLLIQMAPARKRRRILLVGGAYIAAVFLFHLLVGIGIFSVFSLSGFSKVFAIIGGGIALLLGIITLTDVLLNRETFILSIPKSKKGLLAGYIRIASLPAAFCLGIIAGILGFTCTGGIYISILGLMGMEITVRSGLPWLILYNLIYVLPLILITLLVAYGISPEHVDQMRGEYKQAIRMVIGVILVALGAVILLGWLG